MAKNGPWNAFGFVVRELRTEQNLSQAELAEKTGVDQTYISLLERGERQPTLATVYAVAAALDKSVIELIELLADRSEHDTNTTESRGESASSR